MNSIVPEINTEGRPMDVNFMKNILQGFMDKAKGLLCIDHCLHPVLFSFTKEGVTPHEIELDSDAAKEATKELMETIARIPGTLGLGLLLDVYAKSYHMNEELPSSIKGMDGTYEAITCMLHLPDASYIRQVTYIFSKEKNRYWFSDEQGWPGYPGRKTIPAIWEDSGPITTESRSRFANPFKSYQNKSI
jgi:hypothetical protein